MPGDEFDKPITVGQCHEKHEELKEDIAKRIEELKEELRRIAKNGLLFRMVLFLGIAMLVGHAIWGMRGLYGVGGPVFLGAAGMFGRTLVKKVFNGNGKGD